MNPLIDNYNKYFIETTKSYTKICRNKPCPYADECDRNGKIVYCSTNDEKRELYYIKGITRNASFSFKDMCKRDDFPNGKVNYEFLRLFYEIAKDICPESTPKTIDVWIEELREMDLYEEADMEHEVEIKTTATLIEYYVLRGVKTLKGEKKVIKEREFQNYPTKEQIAEFLNANPEIDFVTVAWNYALSDNMLSF